MAEDAVTVFLDGLAPEVRPLAADIAAAVPADLTVAIKWRQLTFSVNGDVDHWVCAVAATKAGAALILHFGSLLDLDVFDPSEAKCTRRITYRVGADVDRALLQDVVRRARDALPDFRRKVGR